MVCIAAFIILALMGIFVGILSIFKRDIGKKYWKMFKKAWGCVWKKVRLQKCETGFKEDVKNTIMSRVIIRHPKWVKPLEIILEVLSVIIVIIAVWAIATAIKSLLALWALGTCNVTQPASCALGAEVCGIEEKEPENIFEATGRWFTEWGEIFAAIPDKFTSYNPEEFDLAYIRPVEPFEEGSKIVVDIIDPGCIICKKSYYAQKNSGYFLSHEVRVVPFVIMKPDGTPKFKNSEIAARYMLALKDHAVASIIILEKIFLESDADGDSYQDKFNLDYSEAEAKETIENWLREINMSEEEISAAREKAFSEEVTNMLEKNRKIVEEDIHVKGIPTMIYDGAKHTGEYKAE